MPYFNRFIKDILDNSAEMFSASKAEREQLLPDLEQLQSITRVGKNNIKLRQDPSLYENYNNFKERALHTLIDTPNTAFKGRETRHIELYSGDNLCKSYEGFVKKFNDEKLTNVKLIYEDCTAYFSWKKE